jgi:prophage antirepressor-like protein
MNPSIFNFNEHGVRIVLDANELPLFCLADVCNALGMQRANPSRFNLNPKGTHSLCTPTTNGNQFINFIS